jgi:hypothetical protein
MLFGQRTLVSLVAVACAGFSCACIAQALRGDDVSTRIKVANQTTATAKNKHTPRKTPALTDLDAQRKLAAKHAAKSAALPSTVVTRNVSLEATPSNLMQNASLAYSPAAAPLSVHASSRARKATISLSPPATTSFAHNDSFASQSLPRASVVLIAPTSIDAHMLGNLHEPLIAPPIEMGDRPARGTSLCSDGRSRRFGEIDVKALAQNLPDFNGVRPRTVCVRRGVLMADYGFK